MEYRRSGPHKAFHRTVHLKMKSQNHRKRGPQALFLEVLVRLKYRNAKE